MKLDKRPGVGLVRSLSGLLSHAPPPWLSAPCSALPVSCSRPTRQAVLADALEVSRLLSEHSLVDITVHSIAWVHFRLALHQVLYSTSTNHPIDIHQRIEYLFNTVLTEVLAMEQSAGQDFVEMLFTEALYELVGLWGLIRCGPESVCKNCLYISKPRFTFKAEIAIIFNGFGIGVISIYFYTTLLIGTLQKVIVMKSSQHVLHFKFGFVVYCYYKECNDR